MSRLALDIAEAVRAAAHDGLPAPAERHAERSLLNVLGVAVGAGHTAAVDRVLGVATRYGGEPIAPVPGAARRVDPHWAALATGLAAHLDDFDDTHLATVIHPAAATVGALLGAAALVPPAGAEALTAFALGIEVQLRIGVAVSPAHYDAGWHITGTCGVLGAAVAAGLVLGLDTPRLAAALDLAALQTLGHREAFGTHGKPLHAGKAASNGLLAARIASGLDDAGARDVRDALGVLVAVLDPSAGAAGILAGFGREWELAANTFKPYPCGIVAHPGIDAALELAPRVAAAGGATRIEAIRYECHPLVPELMGRMDPADGLQARFSAAHGVAVGLARGAAGLVEYGDAVVRSAEVSRLRAQTTLDARPDFARAEARVTVDFAGGARERAHVLAARGSLTRPLTDAELHDKVHALVEPVLPGTTTALLEAVDGLGRAPSLAALLGAVTPLPEEATA